MLIIKFLDGAGFFALSCESPVSYGLCFKSISQKEIAINPEILIVNKFGYFIQFEIFRDISGSRQSQINLLVSLLYSIDKFLKRR